jgi:hypothetical protein
MATKLNRHMGLRVNAAKQDAFTIKCEDMGRDAPELIREFMDAFVEGRVRITPSDEQQKVNQELYQ